MKSPIETIELAFEEFGSETNPSLIILHGFFASSRNWRQVAEKLSDQYRVFVLDQRNHGASSHHKMMDYPSMAADLLNFINHQNLKTVSLLGHSMGGKVAMWFALKHCDRINKLIVVDIAPVCYGHQFDKLISALKDVPLAELNNRKQAEEYLLSAIPDLSYRQFLLQNLMLRNGSYEWRVDLGIFQANAANIVAFPDCIGLPAFMGEMQVVAGGRSNFVKPGDFNDCFPTAQFHWISDAGHWLHVEKPAAFLEQLRIFLSL